MVLLVQATSEGDRSKLWASPGGNGTPRKREMADGVFQVSPGSNVYLVMFWRWQKPRLQWAAGRCSLWKEGGGGYPGFPLRHPGIWWWSLPVRSGVEKSQANGWCCEQRLTHRKEKQWRKNYAVAASPTPKPQSSPLWVEQRLPCPQLRDTATTALLAPSPTDNFNGIPSHPDMGFVSLSTVHSSSLRQQMGRKFPEKKKKKKRQSLTPNSYIQLLSNTICFTSCNIGTLISCTVLCQGIIYQ